MMNKISYKNLLIPMIAVFGFLTVWDIVFHGFLMEKIYLENSHLFRPQDEIQKNQNFMHISNIIYSSTLCFLYAVGYENKKQITQGIIFGLVIISLIWVPMAVHDYVIFPYSKILLVSGFIGHCIETLSICILISLTYKLDEPIENNNQPPSLED